MLVVCGTDDFVLKLSAGGLKFSLTEPNLIEVKRMVTFCRLDKTHHKTNDTNKTCTVGRY